MTTQQQKSHGSKLLLRATTFIIIFLLLIAAVTLAILSVLHIIPVPIWLSTVLGVALSVFGILAGFFQWLVPSSPVAKVPGTLSKSLTEHTRQADIDSPNFLKDFFISYNSSDRGLAEWIAWQLELAGYTTILQDWNIKPGANF